MARYEITAHIHEDDERAVAGGMDLLKAVRFEIRAGTVLLAHDLALLRLSAQYPGKTIAVTAKEITDEDRGQA